MYLIGEIVNFVAKTGEIKARVKVAGGMGQVCDPTRPFEPGLSGKAFRVAHRLLLT